MQLLRRTRHLGMSDAVREDRKSGIGGSDIRIIMSGDQNAIERLWHQKRGEEESDDLSEVLLVQLGNVTEPLNQDWFELQTGMCVSGEQSRSKLEGWEVAQSTLDGVVSETEGGDPFAIFEAKFMFPFNWSIEKAVEKYMAQIQWNMMTRALPKGFLSVITGAGQWAQAPVDADEFYQIALLEAAKDFWDCVLTGRTPGVPVVEAPHVDVATLRVVDMTGNNQWSDLAGKLIDTKAIADKFTKDEKEMKTLIPDDAKEAFGYGVTIKRSTDNKLRLTYDKRVLAAAEAAKIAAAKAAQRAA